MRWLSRLLRPRQAQREDVIRDTEVFVFSFPKSGRTWLTVLIGKALCLHYGYPEENIPRTLAFTKKIKAERDPAIRVTGFGHDRSSLDHKLHYREMSGDKSEFAGKDVIFLVRDPKDVVVSYYFQATKRNKVFAGSLSEFVRDETMGIRKVLAFNKNWYDNRDVPRRFQLFTYEQMHEDPHGVLRTTLEIMGVAGVTDAVIDEAVRYGSFDNMRRLEQRNELGAELLKPQDPDDPESFKVRKGEIGGHREYLSDEDIAYIDDCARELQYPL